MKSLIAVGTLAALAAFSSGAQPQQPQNQGATPADPGAGFGPQQLTTFKVRDNFYMIRSGAVGQLLGARRRRRRRAHRQQVRDGPRRHHDEAARDHRQAGALRHQHALARGSLGRQRDQAGFGREGHCARERALPDGQDAGHGPAEPHARRAHAPLPRRVRARPLLARARPHGRRHRGSPARAEDDLHGRPVRDLGSLRAPDPLRGRRQLARVVANARARAGAAVRHRDPGPWRTHGPRASRDVSRHHRAHARHGSRDESRAKKSREDIQKMLEMEFAWSGFVTNLGLDGVIGEMQ